MSSARPSTHRSGSRGVTPLMLSGRSATPMSTARRSSRPGSVASPGARRAKLEMLAQREAAKGDRRAKLRSMLINKLGRKYGARPEHMEVVTAMVTGFIVSTDRVTETDLQRLESEIRKAVGRAPKKERSARPSGRATPLATGRTDRSALPALNSARSNATDTPDSALIESLKGNEWVLLDTFNTVEHEIVEEMQKEHELAHRRKVKNDLDEQRDEARRRREREQAQEFEYGQEQLREHENWSQEEITKRAEAHRREQAEKRERDRQLEEIDNARKAEERAKAVEDAKELDRCMQLIRDEEDRAKEKRKMERAQLQVLLQENEEARSRRLRRKAEEAAEDCRLMAEYKARLDREEANRERGLQRKFKRQEDLTAQAEITRAAEAKREKELYDNILKHQMAREAADQKREEDERAKRRQDAIDRKATLARQLAEKNERESREREEEARFAEWYRREGELAAENEKRKKERRRKQMEAHREELQQQIDNKRPEWDDDMSGHERQMNAAILRKLREDPAFAQKMLQKLAHSGFIDSSAVSPSPSAAAAQLAARQAPF